MAALDIFQWLTHFVNFYFHKFSPFFNVFQCANYCNTINSFLTTNCCIIHFTKLVNYTSFCRFLYFSKIALLRIQHSEMIMTKKLIQCVEDKFLVRNCNHLCLKSMLESHYSLIVPFNVFYLMKLVKIIKN